MTSTPHYSAVRAFIVRDDKVLIIRESQQYNSPNKGKYDLPGGKIAPNESPEECLHREIKEETGMSIIIGEPFCTIIWEPIVNDQEQHITGTFYVCTTNPSPNIILSNDHDNYLWIDPKKYLDYPIIETNKPAFEEYLSRGHQSKE